MNELIVTTQENLRALIREEVETALKNHTPTEPKPTKYLSVAEAAEKLGVSPHTIYRGITSGHIPCKKINRVNKIPSSYVER